MKLFGKIFAIVFISFVVVVLSILSFFSIKMINSAENELIEVNIIMAKVIANEIEVGFVNSSLPFSSLDNLSKRNNCVFWWIVEDNGKIYLANKSSFMRTKANDYFPQKIRGDRDETLIDEDIGVIVNSLKIGEKNWSFWLGLSLRDISSMKKRVILVNLLIFVSALLVLGYILLLTLKHFTKPINELVATTEKIGKGDLSCRALIASDDELGQLARAFNNMADRIQERDDRIRSILESADNIAYIITDIGGTESPILEFSPGAEHIFGYNSAEVVGKPLATLHLPGKVTKDPDLIKTMPQGHAAISWESTVISKNGTPFPAIVTSYPVFDRHSNLTSIFNVYIDITARKVAEEHLKQANAYLENIFDSSVETIAIVDKRGYFTMWNEAAKNTYGYSLKDLEGVHYSELYADKAELDNMLIKLHREGFIKNYEINMRKKNDVIAPFSLSIKLLQDNNYKTIGSVCVTMELTEIKRALSELNMKVAELDQRNRIINLINDMSDSLQSCISLDEAYPLVARYSQQLFPTMAGALFMTDSAKDMVEAVNIWGESLLSELVFHPTDCWAIRLGQAHLFGGIHQEMKCLHLPDLIGWNYICLPLIAHNETLGILHFQGFSEITQEQSQLLQIHSVTVADHISLAFANIRLRESLRYQVMHDPLTDLFNRRYLEETMVREIYRVKRKGTTLGVIMLDLDHFKRFNDTYGHEAGDNLLCALGEFLLTQVRREDVACRYGGEEFVLIMPEASLDVVQARAEEIRDAVPQLQIFQKGQLLECTTVSLGVAIFPGHGATAEHLLRTADDAMYQAKREGRNRVVVAGSTVEPSTAV